VTVNAQYNVASPGSLPVRISAHQRRKMYSEFRAAIELRADETILDVGATSDQSYDHSNYLEAWYPTKGSLTAVGIDDASFLQSKYPGVRFLRSDGCDLPFGDGTFDVVHSSAVLEHVGSSERQARFLRELWRVARKGIFVTTPNRWFPIEFHTVMPLVHWLPTKLHRRIFTLLGKDFFADERNLNLLSRVTLARAARAAGIGSFELRTVSLMGWPTNLVLVGHKSGAPIKPPCDVARYERHGA